METMSKEQEDHALTLEVSDAMRSINKRGWVRKAFLSGGIAGLTATSALLISFGEWKADMKNERAIILKELSDQKAEHLMMNSTLANHAQSIVDINGRLIFIEAKTGFKKPRD